MSSKCPVYLNPYDYAKRSASIEGDILLSQFKRFQKLINLEYSNPVLQVDIHFENDATGKAWIKGTLKGKVSLLCQRCLDDMDYQFTINLDHLFCDSEQCLEDYKHLDVILAEVDTQTRLSDLLEDELLLELPAVAKHEKDCVHGKAAKQMVDSFEQDNKKQQKNNPFAVLKDKFN